MIHYRKIELLLKKARDKKGVINFPVWLRNRLLSAGLEPVLSQTEKACIASNYRQFSTNIKINIIKLIPVLSAARYPRKAVYNTMR